MTIPSMLTMNRTCRRLFSSARQGSLIALTLIMLSGCSTSDDEKQSNGSSSSEPGGQNATIDGVLGGTSSGTQSLALIATRSSDGTVGQIVRLSLSDGYTINGEYPANGASLDVRSFGNRVFEIGQAGLNTVTSYDAVNTSQRNFRISVNTAATANADPQDMVFIDSTKAYLTRRGSNKLWVVDPEPDNNPAVLSDFLISEIDLGEYDIDFPDMTDALIVDDKLFILMERLTRLPDGSEIPDKQAYIAVFDTRFDTEIDTGRSGNNLGGIALLTRNPTALQYNENTGFLYVTGRGNYKRLTNVDGDPYSGGIEAIDPTTYQNSLILNDGSQENNNGFFINGVVINNSLGYVLTADYNADTLSLENKQLYRFNPTSGALGSPVNSSVSGLDNLGSLLAVGPDNHLWLSLEGSTPGFARLNLQTGLFDTSRIATSLIPRDITFLTLSE